MNQVAYDYINNRKNTVILTDEEFDYLAILLQGIQERCDLIEKLCEIFPLNEPNKSLEDILNEEYERNIL